MALPPLTALAFCLVISTGGSQGFTVEPAQSDLYVRIGEDAEFTARPSRAIASGNWAFNSKTIVTWIGTTSSILAEYRSRVNLNFTSGSLVLRSVSESDNGDYTASLTAGGGVQAAVTITLKALEPISQPVVTSNDTRPVEHNVTVTLACAAVGTDVSYAWSMNGLALSPGGRLVLSNGNRTLTISGVLRSDKEFTCTGSNPVNTNTSDPFLLDVSYRPESVNISVSPEQAAHISGSDQVSLTCSAVSKPAPEYQWLFNGLFQQSGQQLVIAALGVNDTGSYTCQVFNNVTKRSSSSTRDIAVIEPVSTPNITSNASSFIEYNDTVILACVAAGTNVSYTWLEDNSVIPNGGRLELSASNTTLTITGVLRSDGPFTCRVSNTLSAETSEPFHLNVFYGPDLPIIIPDPDTPAYISGTDVTLTCSAESKPAAVLGWYLQGDLVQSGPQLTIHNVSTKDIGSYFCQAFNNMTRRYRASSILIDVLELVENVNLRSNNCYPAEHRDSVLFTCDSRGTQLKREWLFNNQPVQQNDRITISGDTLLIDPVNRADTGMYKCIVSNGLNNGSAETYLKVFYGPEKVWILPPAPVVAIVGSNLTLTCLAISEPGGEYHWHNASSWLQSGQVYTLESVSSANSGNYTCLVINHITKRSSRLTVQITATAAAVPETRSGLTPGAIAGIVVGLIAAGLIGGVGGWLIARKTSGPRAEPGTKYDANRSPRGQTTSATDAGNGLATYENLPGNKQGITHAPAGDSTYMGLKLEDRSIYSELHR